MISDPACLEYLSTGRDRVAVGDEGDGPYRGHGDSRYYMQSGRLGRAVAAGSRTHWSIENSLHWSVDVTFREDQSRMRKDHSPQMSTLRQIAHNQLKRETSLKVGIQGKRLQAGWRNDYLLKVLLS